MVAFLFAITISVKCISTESIDMMAYHELSAPPGSVINLDCNPISMMSLRRVSARLQLHSPRDVSADFELETGINQALFVNPGEFLMDINIVRGRFQECRDCPRLESLRRFSRSDISRCMAANRAYQEHLKRRMEFEFDRRDVLHEALIEVRQIYHVYDRMDDAFRACSTVYARQALRDVRHMIGEEAFERGEMPFPLPQWQFREVK